MITKEHIETIERYYKSINEFKEILDEEYIRISENSKERKHKLMRKDGDKEVEKEIPEDLLWYEVKNLGWDYQAGKHLRTIYPIMYETSLDHDKAVADLSAYCLKELRIDPLKITFLDIVRIVDGIIEGKNADDKGIVSPFNKEMI